MPILKTLTVRYLRELARKHLGDGHSRLKTRDDLLAALRRVVPGLVPEDKGGQATEPAEQETTERVPQTARAEVIHFPERATSPAEPKGRAPQASAPLSNGAGKAAVTTAVTTKEAAPSDVAQVTEVKDAPPAPVAPRVAPLVNMWPPAEVPSASAVLDAPAHWAEPVVEGFFVARIAGEGEVRRHHLSAVQAPRESSDGLREPLPEVPLRYDTDRLVLLARDPGTLLLFWDLSADTRGDRQRAELRLFDNGHVVRRVEVPLDAPSWYHDGVQPGRHYRAELWETLADGTERAVGPASNEVAVPADDLSADTTVRFLRVSPDVHLLRLRERRREEAPQAPAAAAGGQAAHGEPSRTRPSGMSLEVLRERWEPGANSGSWQLRSWRERVDLSEGLPLPGPEAPLPPGVAPRPDLTERTWPVGGSSSFTLTSSFGLGGGSGSGSGRGGKS